MSAVDDVLFALKKYYRQESDPTIAAVDLLAQYDADRQAEGLAETSDDAERNCLQHALLFALNWHGTSPAELHAGINKILIAGSDATPSFFQPRHTYTESDGSTDWRFRCDTVTTHPANGERTALGWRHFRGEWEPYAYGEDDWEIHQLVDHIDVTEGGA